MALREDPERICSQKNKKTSAHFEFQQQNASKASFITSRTDKNFYEHLGVELKTIFK